MQFRPGQCYRKKLAGAFCTGSQKNRGKTMDISSKMLGDLTLKVSASLELEKNVTDEAIRARASQLLDQQLNGEYLRRNSAASLLIAPQEIRSSKLITFSGNLRIVTVAPFSAIGGSTILTREPSSSLASQIGFRDEAIRARASQLLDQQLNGEYITVAERVAAVSAVLDNIRHYGVLQPLINDREITEIMINGPKCIFIEKGGFARPGTAADKNVVFCTYAAAKEFCSFIADRGHANSPKDMLSRLETMVLTGVDFPIEAIRQQIGSAIDLIVHLGRLSDKSRKVLDIVEVAGYEDGKYRLNPLFSYIRDKKEMEDGKIITMVSRRESMSFGEFAWPVESEPSCPVFIACSMSSASAPRTSPTTIRSGRIRREDLIRSRMLIAPIGHLQLTENCMIHKEKFELNGVEMKLLQPAGISYREL